MLPSSVADSTASQEREIRDYSHYQKRQEGAQAYDERGFHPVHIGELYNEKYEVLRKLGFGQHSTVWLVRNTENGTHLAMKVLSSICYSGRKDLFEAEILRHLRDHDPSHPGHRYVARLVDEFDCEGPNGKHRVLVFPVYGETIASFRHCFLGPDGQPPRVPSILLKRFTKQLLLALDYAHSAGVIHVHLDDTNVMIQIPDEKVVGDFFLPDTASAIMSINAAAAEPWQLGSQSLFGHYLGDGVHDMLEDFMNLDIAIIDWGVSSWTKKHLTEESLTPPILRPPEMLLDAPWSTPADIFTLGLLLVKLAEHIGLFDGQPCLEIYDNGYYKWHHLLEMECLLGKFPKSLLDAANQKERRSCFNPKGFVDDCDYQLTLPPMETVFVTMEGEDKAQFISMIHAMLVLDPDKRKTAKELLHMDWVKDVQL